jgi:hypothetical protein
MSAATAHSFNKLLSQPKAASKSRATGETDDCTKKLRRMILVEGIPSALVRCSVLGVQPYSELDREQRIQLCGLEYGKYYFELTIYQPKPTLTISLAVHAKCERKYGMILLGKQYSLNNVTFRLILLHFITGLWRQIKDLKNACKKIC